MSCKDVQEQYQSPKAGTVADYEFTFEYMLRSDVYVSLWNSTTRSYNNLTEYKAGQAAGYYYKWHTDTIIRIVDESGKEKAVPPASADPVLGYTPNAVQIARSTDITPLNATFAAGSSIRAKDLNDNFEQLQFVQEAACDAEFVLDYTDKNYWNKLGDTVRSTDAWTDNDITIATTAAIDNRIDTKITQGTVGVGGQGIVISGKKVINDIDTAAGLKYSDNTDSAQIQTNINTNKGIEFDSGAIAANIDTAKGLEFSSGSIAVNLGTNLTFDGGTGAINAGDTSKWNLNSNDLSPKTPDSTNVAIGGTDSTADIYLNSNGNAKFDGNTTIGGTLDVTGAATAAKPAEP